MHRRVRALVVGSAVMLAACSDTTGPKAESASGVWTLISLNSIVLPYPLGSFYGYSLEYTSSRLSLSADSSYHERSIVTERVDGAVVQVDTVDAFGLWRQTGGRVVLRDVAATDSLVGTLNNGELKIDQMLEDSAFHYLYRRQ